MDMKDLNEKQAAAVAGGLEPREYENQAAPEPATDPTNVVDYDPKQPPQ
jgi:hypothetical protein